MMTQWIALSLWHPTFMVINLMVAGGWCSSQQEKI
jgi:hypothetical protein